MQKPEIKIDVVCTSTTGIDIGLLAIGGVSRNALYKFSTYLLTYLLATHQACPMGFLVSSDTILSACIFHKIHFIEQGFAPASFAIQLATIVS